MKVTFIYPAIGISGFGGDVAKYGGEVCWISHGLGLVATQASRFADVDILDMRRLNNWKELEDSLLASKSDWYGVSISTLNAKVGRTVINHVKDFCPESNIVVGGFDPTMNPEKYEDVHCIQGEGEKQIADLLGFEYQPMWMDRDWETTILDSGQKSFT